MTHVKREEKRDDAGEETEEKTDAEDDFEGTIKSHDGLCGKSRHARHEVRDEFDPHARIHKLLCTEPEKDERESNAEDCGSK